jgi:UDP-N-acetylmuramyl tripeptide synthase
MRWRWDAVACPACGGRIWYDDASWACRTCAHARPVPSVTVDGDAIHLDDQTVTLASELPGEHTRANSAMAIAAAALLGVAPADAASAMGTVSEVDGRYRPLWGADRPGRLFLGKNPAGWLEVLEVLEEDGERPVVLVFNAQQPDGRDPSWLWDVPIERLHGRMVIVAGERAVDMAVRLRYAGVDHVVAPSLQDALADGRRLGADVLATYTAFWQVKEVLAHAG